jgi:protein-S-isoprenylcysteine O-methyltransferase Ste14
MIRFSTSTFLLLATANIRLGSAFQVRPSLPTVARIHHPLSRNQNLPLYLSEEPLGDDDGSSKSNKDWSSWNDEAAKKYFQSTTTESDEKTPGGGKADPSTWTNEPPDYVHSGDSSPKKKTTAINSSSQQNPVNSFASTNDSPKEESSSQEKQEDEKPEDKVRPPLSTLFNMEEPGSLVAKSNPWDFLLEADLSPFQILDGKLGERGEAWTALSLVLILSVLGGGIPLPFLNSALTFLAGPGLMLAGAGLLLASVNDLGSRNLTPFLTPTSRGSLVTDGIYAKIRHPIYSGLIALCGGFSIWTEDSNRLVLTAVLYFLLGIKAEKEEEELLKKFPQYAEYRDRSGKFFPGDWSFRF